MLIDKVDSSLKVKTLAKGTVGLLTFSVLMTPLLLSLGFWQLGRAEDKQQLIDQQSQGEAEQLSELADISLSDQGGGGSYRLVSVSGHYRLSEYLLLDNRTREGVVGYEVISLFQANDGQTLLVNRGWVKASPYRDQLPTITSDIAGNLVGVTVKGSVHFPNNQVFTLSEEHIPKGWPKRVQKLDINALSKALGDEMYPFTVRLSDDKQPGALKTGWKVSYMSPDKHIGYAVQWFSLALVLVVMTALAIRKIGESQIDDS